MSADTQQNLFYTVYFLFIHNYQALFFGLGIAVFSIINFLKPKRTFFVIFIGFIILLFAFEYNKHILDSLREQTINSLVTERQSYRIERVVNITLVKLLPKGMMVFGWLMVASGFYFEYQSKKKKTKLS